MTQPSPTNRIIYCKRCAKRQAYLLFHGEVPENLIQKHTGHTYVSLLMHCMLQQFRKITRSQLLDVSNMLSNNSKLKTDVVPDTKGDDAL